MDEETYRLLEDAADMLEVYLQILKWVDSSKLAWDVDNWQRRWGEWEKQHSSAVMGESK